MCIAYLRTQAPTCLSCLLVHMPTYLPCLRAHVVTCLACLRAHVPTCLAYLRAHVPLHLACLRAHEPTCLAFLCPHMSICLACSHANMSFENCFGLGMRGASHHSAFIGSHPTIGHTFLALYWSLLQGNENVGSAQDYFLLHLCFV